MKSGLDLLRSFINEIQDRGIRNLVEGIIDSPVLSFTNAKPVIKLEDSPAAPRKHHFFTGGLLLHTYSVVSVALLIVNEVNRIYGLTANRDIVIATAILHDIFKYYQYAPDEAGGGYKLRDDWFLGHDYAVVAELSRRNAPEKLIRAISEVHGQVPFTTTEGLIVHLADSIDAKFAEIMQNILLSRVREYERDCPIYKALDRLIARAGIQRVLNLLFNDPNSLKEMVGAVCREVVLKI